MDTTETHPEVNIISCTEALNKVGPKAPVQNDHQASRFQEVPWVSLPGKVGKNDKRRKGNRQKLTRIKALPKLHAESELESLS